MVSRYWSAMAALRPFIPQSKRTSKRVISHVLARASHFRFSPDSRRIVVQQQMTFRVTTQIRNAPRLTSGTKETQQSFIIWSWRIPAE
jgi:hypothetical protein